MNAPERQIRAPERFGRAPAPQGTWLYRLIAGTARLRLGYLLRDHRHTTLFTALFVFVEAATALGIITAAAYLIQLPLLFPPLGPSAFILFRTPMAAAASPRSVILAHVLALAAGLFSLLLVDTLVASPVGDGLTEVNGPRIASVALAMGLASVAMIARNCAHPPAAATALIAAMGSFQNPTQIVGFLLAVTLLVGQATVFNRILGGLPYPRWSPNLEAARFYGPLAGIPGEGDSFWGHLQRHVFRRRTPDPSR